MFFTFLFLVLIAICTAEIDKDKVYVDLSLLVDPALLQNQKTCLLSDIWTNYSRFTVNIQSIDDMATLKAIDTECDRITSLETFKLCLFKRKCDFNPRHPVSHIYPAMYNLLPSKYSSDNFWSETTPESLHLRILSVWLSKSPETILSDEHTCNHYRAVSSEAFLSHTRVFIHVFSQPLNRLWYLDDIITVVEHEAPFHPNLILFQTEDLIDKITSEYSIAESDYITNNFAAMSYSFPLYIEPLILENRPNAEYICSSLNTYTELYNDAVRGVDSTSSEEMMYIPIPPYEAINESVKTYNIVLIVFIVVVALISLIIILTIFMWIKTWKSRNQALDVV